MIKTDKVIISEKLRHNIIYNIPNSNKILHFTYNEMLYFRGKEATVTCILDKYSVMLDIDKGKNIWPIYLLNPVINYKDLLENGMFGNLSDNRVFTVVKPFLVLESGILMNISDFDDELYSAKYNRYISTLSKECTMFRDYYNSDHIDLSNFIQKEKYVCKTVDELKKYYEDSTKEKVIIVYDLENEDNI